MNKVKSYLSLIKFSHTIFAMPFALIGFFLGLIYYSNHAGTQWNLNRTIGWAKGSSEEMPLFTLSEIGLRFILVLLCMIFARSAAMAFNRYLDRQFDAKNP